MNDKQKLDPIILREYDIRGVVGENLNAGEVGKLMLPTDLKAAKMQNDFLKVITTMNSAPA